MFRVPAAGGTPVVLSERDSDENDRTPWFLPDGRHYLYTVRRFPDFEKSRIYVDSIEAKPGAKIRKEVQAANSNAVYASGYLLFVREGTLMAQPFDTSKLQTTGDPVPIAEQVDYSPGNSQGQFSASRNGTLVYVSGAAARGKKQLAWFDRSGTSKGPVGKPADIIWAAISPDGAMVATDPLDVSGSRDIWLHDLARGTDTRFTFGPNNDYPVWAGDGSRVAFVSASNRENGPYAKAANGLGAQEALDKRQGRIDDWSRDGRYIIEETSPGGQKTGSDIWVIPQFGDKKPFPYLNFGIRGAICKAIPQRTVARLRLR